MESEGMGREEVCSTISSLPGQLSQEDVEDFFSLAHYYASRTPQSFRKVLHTHHISSSSPPAVISGLPQSHVWQWAQWNSSGLSRLPCSLSAYQSPGGPGLQHY